MIWCIVLGLLLAGFGLIPSARAAPSFSRVPLSLSYPAGIATAPHEVPILGVKNAAEWADLRVVSVSGNAELAPSIDPVRRVLRFTPPTKLRSGWNESFTETFAVFDKDTPNSRVTLDVQINLARDFVFHGVRYGSPRAAPVALANNALVVYPDGSPAGERLICLTGKPSDFVLGPGGNLAYVLLGSGTVATVDLVAQRVVATVKLVDFKTPSDPFYTTGRGRIALGVDGQIFTLDEINPGTLRRQSLLTGKTLQTLPGAPTTTFTLSWTDIATGPDRTTLWAFASGGFYSDEFYNIFQRTPLDAKGAALAPVRVATNTGPTRRFNPSPRILLTGDGRLLAIDRQLYDIAPSGVPQLRRELSAVARVLAPGGTLLALDGAVLDLAADIELPVPRINIYTSAPPFYFLGDTYLTRVNPAMHLRDAYRAHVLANRFEPGDKRLVFPTARLAWPRFPGATRYRIQLWETLREGVPLNPKIPLLDAEIDAPEVFLPYPLQINSTYEWRLAPRDFPALTPADVTALGADFTGDFTVTDLVPDQTRLDLQTLAGLAAYDHRITLDTATPATAWTLRSDQAWLQPQVGSGVGPAEVVLRFDATTLPADANHTATLTLATSTTTLAIPVNLTVVQPRILELIAHPSDPRCFALTDYVSPTSPSWAVEIDTATRRLTRGTPLPRRMAQMLVHPQDDALFFRGFPRDVIFRDDVVEFHTISLADFRFRTIGTIPNFTPLAAAGSGRLFLPSWTYEAPDSASLLDTRTGAVLPGPAALFGRGVPSPDGSAFYRVFRRPTASQPARLLLEKVSLTAPGFPVVASADLTGNGFDHNEAPTLPGPDRVAFNEKEFDLDLRPLTALAPLFPEPITRGASGSLRLATTQAYDLNTPAAGRSVAPASSPKALNPATGVFVFTNPDQRSLNFRGWHQLSPLPTPPVAVDTITHDRVTLRNASDPDSVAYRVQYRTAGSETWSTTGVYGSQTIVGIGGLQASTAYEFRVSYLIAGILSNWSEPVSITTAIAPPTWRDAEVQAKPPVGVAGAAFTYTLPVGGSELTLEVNGLPAGLAFDPATRTLSGTASAGRHTISVRAENSSGSFTVELVVVIQKPSSLTPTARYTGLIDLTELAGPLVGRWSATRSGFIVTGSYQSAIFTRPFQIYLKEPSFRKPLENSGYTYISYQGVTINLSATWEQTTDTLALRGYTENAVEGFSFRTTEDTGLASHWSAKGLPYPHAARYTALLTPGEGENPRPDGYGNLTLNITADGAVSLTGENALGQKLTLATHLADDHSLPFFHYNRSDSLTIGGMGIATAPPSGPRLEGALAWAKYTNPKAAAYRAGFEQELLVLGAPLPVTGKNLPPLSPLANPAGTADFFLADGGLARLSKPIAQTITPAPTGFTVPKAGTPANPNRVAVKLDSATGTVTGSAAVLDALGKKTVRTVNFRGILVKDPIGDGEDVIGGYFLLPDAKGVLQSGRFEITEPEAPVPVTPE